VLKHEKHNEIHGTPATNQPPDNIIQPIIDTNTELNCVIDIGQDDKGQWSVVEVNHPFALSSYNFPIDQYVDYCRITWKGFLG
jgi:hypothetical protein